MSAPPPLPVRSGCLAPAAHLYLFPDGEVRPCCRSRGPLGNVAEARLTDIWRGEVRRVQVASLAAGTYPEGCEDCEAEVAVEGRDEAFPSVYDRFGEQVAAAREGMLEWPARMEFNLSNTCNLMCIQCDGSLSSMIRLHREELPPIPKAYGEEFFEDLEAFIPHLGEAQFAGGEPFLAPENFRVWELIERLNPELPCTVVTNATQWNARIERVGRTLRMGYTFSIDGMSAATYEQVRINADYDRVMANVPRYLEMAEAKGAEVEVNFCLMRQNHHEFAELLLWAESRGIKANAQVVRSPEHCSLASLPRPELRAVVARLERQSDEVLPQLRTNRATWVGELARLRSWAEAPEGLRVRMWRKPPPPVEAWTSLGMLVDAEVAPDLDVARARLTAWSDGAPIHEVQVDFDADRDDEQDHLVVALGPEVEALVGLGAGDLVGRPLDAVAEAAAAPHGGLIEVEVLEGDGQVVETAITYAEADALALTVAERDAGGRLVGARLLWALRVGDRGGVGPGAGSAASR